MSRYDDAATAAAGKLSKSLPDEMELTLAAAVREDLPLSELRKRHIWHGDVDSDDSDDSLRTDDDDDDDDSDLSDDDLAEEDDVMGCPLPSTPEDHQLLEEEVNQLL